MPCPSPQFATVLEADEREGLRARLVGLGVDPSLRLNLSELVDRCWNWRRAVQYDKISERTATDCCCPGWYLERRRWAGPLVARRDATEVWEALSLRPFWSPLFLSPCSVAKAVSLVPLATPVLLRGVLLPRLRRSWRFFRGSLLIS